MTTWSCWADSHTTCGTATTTGDPWVYWSSGTSATTVTSAVTTWTQWTTCNISGPSSEQIAAANKAAEARRERARVIEETARKLLSEVLTDEQDEQLAKDGFFELTAINSGNRYRVSRGRSRNVALLDKEGNVSRRLCFHPANNVHDYDTMAAQKLMLESDEATVQRVANYS